MKSDPGLVITTILLVIVLCALGVLKYTNLGKYLECTGISLSADEIITLSKKGLVSPSFEHYHWDWEGNEPAYLDISYKSDDGREVRIKPASYKDYKKVVAYIKELEDKRYVAQRVEDMMEIMSKIKK